MASTSNPPTEVPEPVRTDGCGARGTSLTLSTLTGPLGEMHVVAVGEVDMVTAAELLACLDGALAHPSCRTVLVDLREVGFMSTRGLDALAIASARASAAGVRLAVVADHRPVLRLMEITSAGEWCAVFPTPAAARAAGTDRG
ncbi:STAS domain-containing protein [Pseudonocardia sp. GCM10023141]|uniref:STAS domain-containing protein n=1 Tax=Pseudonocardia sp. GCM10023141 TaxID=3252653 RepID=UPI00361E4552